MKAGCIAFTKGRIGIKVLLVKSSYSGRWGFPKGDVEPGETPIVGARREFREETGVEINIPSESMKIVVNGEPDKHFFVLRFRNAFATNPQDEEITDARWFGLDEITQDSKVFTYDPRFFKRIMEGKVPQYRNVKREIERW